jgi:hypothetical protein
MPSMRSEHADQFVERPKLLTACADAQNVAQNIKAHRTPGSIPRSPPACSRPRFRT